jgi:NitT/TauT family transport system ATP-binding protein
VSAEIRADRLVVSLRRASAPPVRALDQLDLRIPAGCICAVVGKSGCGKSTLLNAIAGVLDRNEASVEGSVTLVAASSAGGDATAPAVGMVFQRSFLMPWSTALENVGLYHRLRGGSSSSAWRARAEELLARVGLKDHGDKFPHQLSGGMQQRVALIREFARPLDVLLMDEPFAALDRVTRDQLNDDVLMFWRELEPTIVLVTHDPEEAVRIGDRVVVIERGRVAADFDVSAQLPRNRGTDVRRSTTFRDLVECVLATLHGKQ